MSLQIIEYPYIYLNKGDKAEADRRVIFERTEEHSNALYGRVQAKINEKWVENSIVRIEQITVDLCTTSEKLAIIEEARSKNETPQFKIQKMNEFNINDQNKILNFLKANDPYVLSITTDIGGIDGMEKVTHLAIFNPIE